jgi:hypothetical protein
MNYQFIIIEDLPANLTWNLFSGRNIWTYCGHSGAKSLIAQDLIIVCWSCENIIYKYILYTFLTWIYLFLVGFLHHTNIVEIIWQLSSLTTERRPQVPLPALFQARRGTLIKTTNILLASRISFLMWKESKVASGMWTLT